MSTVIVRVFQQANLKHFEDCEPIDIGSKFFSSESTAKKLVAGNNFLYDGAWYLAESVLIVDEVCPKCDSLNAYAWQDCNDPKSPEDYDSELPKVYHISACSGYEWTCGCCGASWTPSDSPINADVYTHGDNVEDEE